MEQFIENIMREAGAILMEKFKKVGVKYTKENPGDVVTEADLASNELLIRRIKEKYPDHGFISEETGEENVDAEYVWIIDPLDGTRNYATHTPLFGVMIAVRHKDELEHAAVYDPVHDELVYAQKGKEALLNGQPIACSLTKEFEYSYGCGSAATSIKNYAIKHALLERSKIERYWMNDFGSIAIAAMYVAEGKRDWNISCGGKVWDYAPVSLILREAGCVITNLEGRPWRLSDDNMIAANAVLHKQLMEIVNKKY